VPLIDRDEFERAKVEAARYWRERGDAAAADAFLALEIAACGFGLDASARLAWGVRGGVEVGLRFDLESGAYVNSFVRRVGR
jgi:hypothetical protein